MKTNLKKCKKNLDAKETLLICSSCLELCSQGQSRSSQEFVGERGEVFQNSTTAPAENACPLPHTGGRNLNFIDFLERKNYGKNSLQNNANVLMIKMKKVLESPL